MKLAVPDMISNSYFPAEAAVELGFFKAEGLDVSLELIFPVDKAYAALHDGAVDFVGGSAHSALAAFPDFRGLKLICAQAQGMYWFLVMHADLKARRGDVSAVKGRSIGAAPWVDKGLRGLLTEAAHTAVRFDADWRRQYVRLAMKKNRSIAAVAIARKLAVRLWWMWKLGLDYGQMVESGSHVG